MKTRKLTRLSVYATKRGFDFIGAALGLLLLLPILPFIALAIKTTSSGPVLYRQLRVGTSPPSL